MNKSDLIAAIAAKTGDTKKGAEAAWETVTGGRANAWQISAGYFF